MARTIVPKVFLSWGSPDSPVPERLSERLQDTGLEVWQYRHDMPAGADIPRTVLDIIHQVEVAVICFSDETATRDWIEIESSWCYADREDPTRPLKNIKPVWVGPHPRNEVPASLRLDPINVFDLSAAREEDYHRLVLDILGYFKNRAPRVVPAALFAMNQEQFQRYFGGNPPAEPLASLCRTAGMHEELLASLGRRYGDTPEDFAPFQPGQTLRGIVDAILRKTNQARIADRRPPIVLRWIRDELVGPRRQQALRKQWNNGESLLIVDSVSTFHPELQDVLERMPELTRTAILWIPPFTHYTVAFEEQLRAVAETIEKLGDAFECWGQPRRSIAFDMITSVSFRLWLHRTFDAFEDEDAPLLDLIESLPASSTSSVNELLKAGGETP